ncbi:LysR family transcriptional regulator [Methylobacterium nodulans]|uniref:Transcriptional regulator, LysR family n=1 Tax=Methylobacterium nodulans (strain LMG 21967 / CNCM I-2342 / ORS 2060) TaxID=460265 RepID=B8IQQ7_METNO|nr:LysR family transcriptional regulator [Methylobacterium nodulans]ACL62352.1 transcriptional regulator, LysR family [Methylobacterium nodulans ORS 2060]
MFLRQFKYLLAVVDEEHFGRAAERCNVTQPSLSVGIKQLELEIGVPIFLRGRGQRFHGLTPEGERVVKWARNVVGHCEAMRDEIAEMRGNLSGRLRMGAMPSMSPVLPVLLQLVRKQHPNVVMDVRFLGNDAMKTGLNNFSLDAALTYLDTAELGRRNSLKIYTEKLCVLVPDTEEFRNRASITWREVADLPLAMLRPAIHERRFVDTIFDKVGRHPRPQVESESIMHLMFQVQFGGLCTIIPEHFTRMPGLHRGTKALQVVEPVVSQDVGLFWAEGELMTPIASILVSAVKDLNKRGGLDLTLNEPRTESPSSWPTSPPNELPFSIDLRNSRRPRPVKA